MISKMRKLRKHVSLFLCITMLLGLIHIPAGAAEITETEIVNVVLNKSVTATAGDANVVADGNLASASYWDPRECPASFTIDLDNTCMISSFKAFPYYGDERYYHYEIYTSIDGEEYSLAAEKKNNDLATEEGDLFELSEEIAARYIRVTMTYNSLYEGLVHMCEFEAYGYEYKDPNDPRVILENIQKTAPTISEDGTSILLPEFTHDVYKLELYATSNESVIGTDGTVYAPLEDMDVTVMYQLVNKTDETDVITSETEVEITIPGKYEKDAEDNAKPDVIPALREWKGSKGAFCLSDASRIVIETQEQQDAADMMAYYFKEMLNKEISVVLGEPQDGDISLSIAADIAELGDEGYFIEIDDIVTVSANTSKGLLYAAATLTQILYQDDNYESLPKGLIRDYPQYGRRSAMIDVARYYMPLDYIEEIAKYMSYYKLNEIRLHVNDDGGEQQSAFRLESKLYPEINTGLAGGKDRVYTQEAYKAFQKEMVDYGITVITEFDSPAHSSYVGLYNPDYLYSSSGFDASNPEAVAWMKSLYDEFMDGEDPVIQNSSVHIGFDEFLTTEVFMNYCNEMIAYVNEKGLDASIWSNHYAGEIEINKDVTVHMWKDYNYYFDGGYDLMNNCDYMLYIVPNTMIPHGHVTTWGDYMYVDRYNFEYIYENWEGNVFNTKTLPLADPRLKGIESSFWNDQDVAQTKFDCASRLKEQIMMVSEKGWYGSKTENQSAEEFMDRIDRLGNRAPGGNPLQYVEGNKEHLVASYDFETAEDSAAKDTSGNGYDAVLLGVDVLAENNNKYVELDGDGSIELPFDGLGFPYMAEFDLYIDETSPEDAVLFESENGTFYLNYKGTGKIGFETHKAAYVFKASLETNTWNHIMITCDEDNAHLYIGGVYMATAEAYIQGLNHIGTANVLGTQAIGSSVVGRIDNIKLYNTCRTIEDLSGVTDLLNGVETAKETLRAAKAALKETELTEAAKAFVNRFQQNIVLLERSINAYSSNPTDKGLRELAMANKFVAEQTQRLLSGDVEIAEYDISELLELVEGKLAEEEYFESIYTEYFGNYLIGLSTLMNVDSTQDNIDSAVTTLSKAVEKIIEQNKSNIISKIESNRPTYLSFGPENACDGDTSTKYWTGDQGYDEEGQIIGAQKVGDYVLITLKDYYKLKDMTLQCLAGDAISYGDLQVSVDGANWTTVGKLVNSASQTVSFDAVAAKYARIVLTYYSSSWFAISEISFTYDVIEKADLETLIAELEDKDLDAYVEETATVFTAAMESAKAVSGNADATEEEINSAYADLVKADVNLLPVKDKAQLADLLAEVEGLNLINYNKASVAVLTAAADSAKLVINDELAAEEEISRAYQTLENAKANLLIRVNKNSLDALITEVDAIDLTKYTEATGAVLLEALVAAKDALHNDDATQVEVDEAYNALLNAKDGLLLATDKSELEALVAEVEAMNMSKFTEESIAAVNAALESAKAVLADINATSEEVSAANAALTSAKANLKTINIIASVSSNRPTYEPYGPEKAYDGDLSTKYWTGQHGYDADGGIAGAQKIGDYVLVELSDSYYLKSMSMHSPHDVILSGDLMVSSDGETWTKVGTVANAVDQTIAINAGNVRYVKIVLTSKSDAWLCIGEISFDYEKTSAEEVNKAALTALIAEVEGMDLSGYTEESAAALAQALAAAKEVLADAQAAQEAVDAAWAALADAKAGLEEEVKENIIVNVSSNRPTYEPYGPENAYDGDLSTKYWTGQHGYDADGGIAGAQKIGDYVLIELADHYYLKSMTMDSPHDVIVSGDLMVSSDGENWTTVGTVANELTQTIAIETGNVKYVKIVLTSKSDAVWLCISEIAFDYEVEQKEELAIVTQPVDTMAGKGSDASVYVEATGEGLTYTWYYKNPGNKKFYTSGTKFVSEDGTTYTIPMYAWRDGQEVYCVVTDANGDTVQSNTVTLTMDYGSIQIVTQPEDVVVETTGDTAVVTVEATGEGLTYQWFYKNPGNVKFYASGEEFVSEDGTTYTIPVAAWRDGQEVYCVITDINGITVQTNTVTLCVAK